MSLRPTPTIKIWRWLEWSAVALWFVGFALLLLRSNLGLWLLLASVPLLVTWFGMWNWTVARSALERRRSRV